MAVYAIEAEPTTDAFNMGQIAEDTFSIIGTTYVNSNSIIMDIREYDNLGFQFDTVDNDATYKYRVQGTAIEFNGITDVTDADFTSSDSGSTGQDIVGETTLANTNSQIVEIDISKSIVTAVRVQFRNESNSSQVFSIILRSYQK